MTKTEAWRIIDSCKHWNDGQKSTALAFQGVRTPHDDMLDARREALRRAWLVVSGQVGEGDD